jgi:hypothetical protein
MAETFRADSLTVGSADLTARCSVDNTRTSLSSRVE